MGCSSSKEKDGGSKPPPSKPPADAVETRPPTRPPSLPPSKPPAAGPPVAVSSPPKAPSPAATREESPAAVSVGPVATSPKAAAPPTAQTPPRATRSSSPRQAAVEDGVEAADGDVVRRQQVEIIALQRRLHEMEALLNESIKQQDHLRAVSRSCSPPQPAEPPAVSTPSESDEPALGDVMGPVDVAMYLSDSISSDENAPLLSPRLHSHSSRLRHHQMTAAEILSEAPPPPASHVRRVAMQHMLQTEMGDAREVGSWAWWARGSDAYVRDGCALTAGSPDGVKKLRALRGALEAQMSEDVATTVVLDASACSIASEGCHTLAVLLASPRVSHTAIVTALDLSSNPFGDDGLGIILQGLTLHAQEFQRLPLPLVRRLVLSRCGLRHGCGLVLALHCFFGEVCLFPDLEVLDLSMNDITPDAFRTLLEAVGSQCGAAASLQEVDFSDCHLSPLAMVFLIDALDVLYNAPAPALRRINVAGHRFGTDLDDLLPRIPPEIDLVLEVPLPA